MLSRGGSVQRFSLFCIFVRKMVSATVRIAIWRVEHDVIEGFHGSVKPALVSIHLYSPIDAIRAVILFFALGKDV